MRKDSNRLAKSVILEIVLLVFGLAASTRAAPIGPGDFGSDATVLSFDSFAHGTALSRQFECSDHVIFRSTAPIGAEFSPDPADSLQPGEATSAFVAAIMAVPAFSTSSPPNKIIATKYDAGGGLIQCERCGIAIDFLDPLPTRAGLYVTDADAGQSVIFSGPSGFLGRVTIAGTNGGPEFAGWEDPGGISEIILRSTRSAGIGFDDLTSSARATPVCAAPPSSDAGGDGVPDAQDVCPNTPAGAEVDAQGCSRDQFCARVDATTELGADICMHSDWKNDEPLGAHDCKVNRGGRGRADNRCVAR